MENGMKITEKIKSEIPYDPAILLLGIYAKKMKLIHQRDTCTPMFVAAPSTISQEMESTCEYQ
jgi:hypothetical protein